MTEKHRWNIWRIENRFLRAIFALVVVTPLFVGAGIAIAFIAICAGLGEGACYGWHVFKSSDVGKMWAGWWLAVCLKEAA